MSVKSNANYKILSDTEHTEPDKEKKNAEYLRMLDKSMAEAAAGKFVVKSIAELEAME